MGQLFQVKSAKDDSIENQLKTTDQTAVELYETCLSLQEISATQDAAITELYESLVVN